MNRLPAVLGGEAAFDPPLPFARPTLEEPEKVLSRIESSLAEGRLTNGPLVQSLEDRVAEVWGVAQCVAVSSCTAGLMLLIQALDGPGPVLMPSFTFSATAHAATWNRRRIVFADCDPATWCLTSADVQPDVSLIVAVHLSGVACDVEGLEAGAAAVGADLIFDSAHGSGTLAATRQGAVPVGRFGRAEVFSLTPTKVLSGVEGGLITTDDPDLAAHLRTARNYGNAGDYDTHFAGINARLSELHAAVALASLDHLEERVVRRNRIAETYRSVVGDLPGVSFQQVPAGTRSSYKDLTILIDHDLFGTSRDALRSALRAEGIETRAYYAPPVHRQQAYARAEPPLLPVTDRLAEQALTLPMWSHLDLEDVEKVGEVIRSVHHHAHAVVAAISAP